jgi:hypothetical protein
MGGLTTLWNLGMGAIEPVGWVGDTWDWAMGNKSSDDIPLEMKQRVDLISEAQKQPGNRAKEMHGWTLDEGLSTDRVAVYTDETAKEVHTVIRGTQMDQMNTSDFYQDAQVLVGYDPDGWQDVAKTLQYIDAALSLNYDLDVSAYSLGGSQLTSLYQNDPTALKNFSDILLVNPGGSAFNTTGVEQIMADDKTTLFSNRSDIISAPYVQHANDPSKVYYGPHSANPQAAHSEEQFGTNFDAENFNTPAISTMDVVESLG